MAVGVVQLREEFQLVHHLPPDASVFIYLSVYPPASVPQRPLRAAQAPPPAWSEGGPAACPSLPSLCKCPNALCRPSYVAQPPYSDLPPDPFICLYACLYLSANKILMKCTSPPLRVLDQRGALAEKNIVPGTDISISRSHYNCFGIEFETRHPLGSRKNQGIRVGMGKE